MNAEYHDASRYFGFPSGELIDLIVRVEDDKRLLVNIASCMRIKISGCRRI